MSHTVDTVDMARSIPGYDDHGSQEFSHPGILQTKSSRILSSGFTAVILVGALQIVLHVLGFWVRPIDIAAIVVTVDASVAARLMGSLLRKITPEVERKIHWEMDRWVRWHSRAHTVLFWVAGVYLVLALPVFVLSPW
jgi:hypothetical protein